MWGLHKAIFYDIYGGHLRELCTAHICQVFTTGIQNFLTLSTDNCLSSVLQSIWYISQWSEV